MSWNYKEFWEDLDYVKFVSTVPGVADMFPIRPMSSYKPNWTKKAMEDYKKNYKLNDDGSHIALCPGIFDLFKFGWYVSAWYDVYIKTEKGRPGFSWRVASGDLMEQTKMNVIDTHGDMITKFIPKRDGRINNIVKINTPYNIIAPPEMKFLFLPMPYPDHYDWESSSGVLEPALSSELNVQLYWNVEEGERFIKAGTPLMQIVPISEKDLNMVCRDANEKEMRWIEKKPYWNSFSFSPVRNKVKELYKRYFQ